MFLEEKEPMLHLYTKHTNYMIPGSKYVDYYRFPAQNQNLLNKVIALKIMDLNVPGGEIRETSFLVVRCDIEEPNRMICISTDYKYIAVTDSKNYDNIVSVYPVQLSEYIGLVTTNKYKDGNAMGITLRVDNGEPTYTVMIEKFKSGTVRYILGDECVSILTGYLNLLDCDGKDPQDHEIIPLDLDGRYAPDENERWIDADGGWANPFKCIGLNAKTKQHIKSIIEANANYSISVSDIELVRWYVINILGVDA